MERKIIDLDSTLTKLYCYGKGIKWKFRSRTETDMCSYKAGILKGLSKMALWGCAGVCVIAAVFFFLTYLLIGGSGIHLLFPLVVGVPVTAWALIVIKRFLLDRSIEDACVGISDSVGGKISDKFESFFSIIHGIWKDIKHGLCRPCLITNDKEEGLYNRMTRTQQIVYNDSLQSKGYYL